MEVEVIVTCKGKNHLAKFTCTGDRIGCLVVMSNNRFNSHMKLYHPHVDAYNINNEARRSGKATFIESATSDIQQTP